MVRTAYVSTVAVGLLAAVISSNIKWAFATDDCLAEPNRQAAPGEHWYYRSDPANNRKCWHIGESGIKPPQEAPVTPTSYPALQAQHAPSTRPEQPDEQRELPTNQAESGPFEE
jgi:hypothetical protein